MSTSDGPTFLSVDDAAQLLGVNRKTIHALFAQGLPHLRLGKRIIRIDRDQLVRWGQRRTKEPHGRVEAH